MGHIRNILVPIDGSPASTAALEYAVTLAEDLGASIEVLHVNAPDEFEVGSVTAVAPSAHEKAERDMNDAADAAASRLGDRLRRRTVSGDPIHKILEVASEEKPDLIVMGTHGRVGRLQVLVGSVAQAVVRSSSCPVLTVRAGEEESFAERIHRRPTIGEQTPSSR